MILAEGTQTVVGFGAAAALVVAFLYRHGEPSGVLLFAYWSIQVPLLAEQVALGARQYPFFRSILVRFLEPMDAPEAPATTRCKPVEASGPGIEVAMSGVSVKAAGHWILREIDLRIQPGEHLAVVGPSGAGKSTLLGLLLGFHRAVAGTFKVNGDSVDQKVLERLHKSTVWVDPAVQLWNRSLLENLLYGSSSADPENLGEAVRDAELEEVLLRLPNGMSTVLGEGGGLVAGGEGQRVRLGRAILSQAPGLVLLDEALRGLDREKRKALLEGARRRWRQATLLCVTHDIEFTTSFPRVLVMEGGRLVEEGSPGALLQRPDSHYRRLVELERRARKLWRRENWRRIQVKDGRVEEVE